MIEFIKFCWVLAVFGLMQQNSGEHSRSDDNIINKAKKLLVTKKHK